MDNLTAKERRLFNALSGVHDSEVKLGDILAELIGASCESGTPVNAVNASAIIAISGVSIHGETLTIGNDTYEFLTDLAQKKSAVKNIAINIASKIVKASGVLTIDTQPTSGDTITIGEKTYIFVPVGTANSDGEISIGEDVAGAQAAIVAAINGTDNHNVAHELVTAASFIEDELIITSIIGGTIGNSIATTETLTAITNIFDAVALASGADCSAANTAAAIIAAITGNSNSLVDADEGTGNNVALTAKTAGVGGNAIGLDTTMANATFTDGTETVVSLVDGVDGTIASGMKFMADISYMYFCPFGNTISDKNWRRVSLGSVY